MLQPVASSHPLYAVRSRRENEVVLWREKFEGDSCRHPSGSVVVSDGRRLIKLDSEGHPAWKVDNGKWTPFRPAALPDGGAVWSPGGKGITFYDSCGTATKVWGAEHSTQTTLPTVAEDGTVYVCVRTQEGSVLAALRADRAEPVFEAKLPFFGSGPCLPDGRGGVIFRTDDDRVVALDSAGQERWQQKLGDRLSNALNGHLSLGPEGEVYIGNERGQVFRLEPDDGRVSEFFKARKAVRAAPHVTPEGQVYIASFDHNLYAVDRDGQELWRHDCGDLVDCEPAVLEDRTVIVGSNARKVWGLGPDGQEKWSQDVGFWVEGSIVTDGRTAYVAGDDELIALRPGGLAADLDDFQLAPANQVSESSRGVTIGHVRVPKKTGLSPGKS